MTDPHTEDSSMAMYVAQPEGDVKGGIVVVQEAFGLTEHIESICDRLADDGWIAVAPTLFHRMGSPVLGYDDLESAMPLVKSLTSSEIDADIDTARRWITAAGIAAERQAILGFCMGGSVAWAQAVRSRWGAAITYYGSGFIDGRFGYTPLIDSIADLKAPWIGYFGDEDQSIPSSDVDRLAAALKNAPVAAEVHRYPGAGHAFNCYARPDTFHEPSAADAWSRTLDWLNTHIPSQ